MLKMLLLQHMMHFGQQAFSHLFLANYAQTLLPSREVILLNMQKLLKAISVQQMVL
jgi:hypothetical protein